MQELYREIENKIKASGYLREIHGEDVYLDICEQIDDKEEGQYMLLSKFEEDVTFMYQITVMEDNFNLGILTIHAPEGTYTVNFDAEE